MDLLGELTRNARPMLLVLIGATLLVLLIACANVASLSMARALARERELSLRTALGASRWQIGGQLLAESVLLSLAGGAVGLVVAWSTIDALTTFAGRFTSRIHDVSLDQGVLGFALGLSLLTGVIFGAFPALTSRPAPAGALKQAGAGGQGPRRRRLQQSLVVAQVAVSVVLLAGAGLLLSSLHRLQSVPTGYRAERVLSAEVFGNFSRYRSAEDFLRLYEPLIDRLSREPGVTSVAITSAVPLAADQTVHQPVPDRGTGRGRSRQAPDRRLLHRQPGVLRHAGRASAGGPHVPVHRHARQDAQSPSSIARWPGSGMGPVPSARACRSTAARRGSTSSAWSRT